MTAFKSKMVQLIYVKESLGRALRISEHVKMMENSCEGCSFFNDFGKHIKEEAGKIADRLEKIISSVEGASSGNKRVKDKTT